MGEEFVKLDAYYLLLARQNIDKALSALTDAENSLASAKGTNSAWYMSRIGKHKRLLQRDNEWLANTLGEPGLVR